MNLAISNIAWSAEHDEEMYTFLQASGFTGLEIAPTRIFPDSPYKKLSQAKQFSEALYCKYGLNVCSMQSIWYGMTQNIFGTDEDRAFLLDYTKQAVDFAEVVGCRNLVFGCPQNRVIHSDDFLPLAYEFFNNIAHYAAGHHTVIALEPNPPYYNTNFINTIGEAFDFCRQINNPGLTVNVDLGTSIHYGDSIDFLNDNIDIVSHIHISEPMLAPIQKRDLHLQLKKLHYDRYFSIEMGNKNDIGLLKDTINYIGEALA